MRCENICLDGSCTKPSSTTTWCSQAVSFRHAHSKRKGLRPPQPSPPSPSKTKHKLLTKHKSAKRKEKVRYSQSSCLSIRHPTSTDRLNMFCFRNASHLETRRHQDDRLSPLRSPRISSDPFTRRTWRKRRFPPGSVSSPGQKSF